MEDGAEVPALHRGAGRDSHHGALLHGVREFSEETVVLTPDVGWPVGDVVSEVVVEPVVQGSALHGPGEVDVLESGRHPSTTSRPPPSEVPLADASGVVAGALQQLGQRDPRVSDQGPLPFADDAAFEP